MDYIDNGPLIKSLNEGKQNIMSHHPKSNLVPWAVGVGLFVVITSIFYLHRYKKNTKKYI